MIERNILAQKMKEFHIKEFIAKEFMKTGYSHTKIQRTPLGDKVTIYTSRPGLVVGRKGETIKKLTNILKNRYKVENPQIEIGEIENPYFDAQSIAEKIAYTLEKFGPKRFKSVGYKTLQSVMDAGALGVEIVIAGKIPSSRAKRWRFMDGYLKKCGHVSDKYVVRGMSTAFIKSGAVGINVSIMPPGLRLPDHVEFIEQKPEVKEQPKKEEVKIEEKTEKENVESKKTKGSK
ncbi:MAG: 30S ribosomal protein S3 [Nanoarchaeota archaeon]|nr:30S ribosomal protein S3 [Nanoarchaeota archaeon]